MFCYILLCPGELAPCELESEELKPECLKPPMTREEKMEKRKQDKQLPTNDNHRCFTKTSQVPAVSEVFPCFFVVGFLEGFRRYEVKLGNEASVFLHLKRNRRCQEIESLKDVLEVLQGTSWEWEAESPWFTASDRRKRWQAWCKVQWFVYYGLLLSIPESNIECDISVWEGSHVFELGAAGVRLKYKENKSDKHHESCHRQRDEKCQVSKVTCV